MPHNIWFTSDTHFYHANILRFTGLDGNLIRPGFASVEEMNEVMIQNWNNVIKDGDKVYHLGDVLMGAGSPEIHALMHRLNGSKRLILGNHDTRYVKDMMPFFKKIQLWRFFKDEGFICSHVPLLPGQFAHKVSVNVHGHIHERMMEDTETYINICVERTNYTPVHMDELLFQMRNRA